jgi:hypothetical protein
MSDHNLAEEAFPCGEASLETPHLNSDYTSVVESLRKEWCKPGQNPIYISGELSRLVR